MNQQDHDKRSLDLHIEVMRRTESDPSLWELATSILDRWLTTTSPYSRPDLEQWRRILDGRDVQSVIADDERGRQLRQSSPLSCVLPYRERWDFLKAWKRTNSST